MFADRIMKAPPEQCYFNGVYISSTQVMVRVTGAEGMLLSLPWVQWLGPWAEWVVGAGSRAASHLWSTVSRLVKREVSREQVEQFIQQVRRTSGLVCK